MKRKPNKNEIKLLEKLISLTDNLDLKIWKSSLLVCPMEDKGMGSLLLFPNGNSDPKRVFGGRVSELIFKDVDGVDVIASLNIDQFSQIYELDVWKTDFGELIELPTSFN